MTNRKYSPGLFIGLFAICIVAIIQPQALAQATGPVIYPDDPIELKKQFIEPTYFPDHITKKPGHYTITDWNDVIDSVWGWGHVKSEKLQVFDSFWNWIDQDFACFATIPGYNIGFWDSLRTLYRTEIANGDSTYGVSQGRFAAMLNYLAMDLKESHTYAVDILVNALTSPAPGVPLFVIAGWGVNDRFGAGLTPLPDSSLLVYRAVSSHPLGLVPGDIVLGYDGIPWKELYPQMLELELPILEQSWWGGAESSYLHSLLMSAGHNWHLFDTLDVVQYSTGDTSHFPTSLLDGQQMELWATEQMDIPGVPMPDRNAGERASFGVIDGTQIGYIYVWAWSGNVEQEFSNAIHTLMTDYETTGLIIDYRTNFGGFAEKAQKGYELLFNTTEPEYGWLVRCDPYDHLALCSNGVPYLDTYISCIYGAANSYYDKPIAVLVGPGAISGGDLNALAMKLHPMARFFGKSTAAAFNRPYGIDMVYNNDFQARYAEAESYLQIDPGQHLTRAEFPVDEEVWLTQSDVAQGNDTVVDAAVAWINSQAGNQPDILCDVSSIDITLDPGEDTTQYLTISNNGTSHLFYSLTPLIDENPEIQVDELSPVTTSAYTSKQVNDKSEKWAGINSFKGPFVDQKELKSTSEKNLFDEKSANPPNDPVILGQGGPDNYGYTWIDSHQPHGPSPDWVDISTVGTPVILGNDAFDGPFGLGFDFNFYGNSYSEIYISSNGFLTFGSGYAGWYNRPIPFNYSPNNFIAPWWDDLDPSLGGDIYYYQDTTNSRFIVSYVDVEKHPESSTGTVTCQAILYADGQIEFNYLDMVITFFGNKADIYTTTIGIENINGSDGLQVFYNIGYFLDNFSVRITTDWLTVTPASGHIAPGDNIVAPVTISARYLDDGIYTGNIYLDSNDPADSNIVIPVSLTVGGGCDYVVGDVNGSGNYNGLDITYGVNFFKYGSPEPQCSDCPPCNGWHYCGDVNASCNYNGLDITYGVNYFKYGSPGPVPCADCPPISGLNPDSGNKSSFIKESEYRNNLDGPAGKAQLTLDSQVDGINNELTVDLKLSCDDPLAFICIPLEWESDVLPKDIVAGDILSGWDMAWGDFDRENKQVLLLGWNDLGGESNPCLDTEGKMIDIFRISFTIENDLQVSGFNIKPAIDDVNGEILLGMEDGVGFIKPEILYGETLVKSGKPDIAQLPDAYSLTQNYPNPFNARTTIEYALPEPSRVNVVVYDILGREIETLESADQPAGYYRVNWEAGNYPSGLYFYRIDAGEFTETKKMLLLK